MNFSYFSEFVPKLATILRGGISRAQLGRDILAGVIVGIMAIPLSLAFAIASGAEPAQGLITAIIGGMAVALLGGSRVQIAGPTGAFIVIVYGIIQRHGMEGLLTATLMAGVMMTAMGLLKFGSLLKYIPQTLIIGFTSAIAFIIFSTQVRDFFGLRLAGTPEGFFSQWAAYARSAETVNPWALGVGLLTLLIILVPPLFAGSRRAGRFPWAAIPWPFVAIVVSAAVTAFFSLPVDTIGSRFGEISLLPLRRSGLVLDLAAMKTLLVPAVSIAILGSLESLLSAVVADSMIGGNHRSNMELTAQGLANVILPLVGGIPATGAIARTAANIRSGGRTPIAGVVHSLFLLIVALFAMPVIAYVPMATLAGITMMVAWNMSEFKVFFSSLRINIYEALVLMVTFLLTIFTDLTISIPVGFVLSLILFMKRMADATEITPLLAVKSEGDTLFSAEVGEYPATIAVYELNGPMFFGSVHALMRIQKELHVHYRAVVLRFRYVPMIDTKGLYRLKALAADLERSRCLLLISGANERIGRKLQTAAGIPADRMFATVQEAVSAACEITASADGVI